MTTKDKPSVADALRAIAEKNGSLTAEIVLKAAEKKSNPLHSHFVWDDTAAARRYRLIQAGELIRRIKVEYAISENRSVRVRAYHHVNEEIEDGEVESVGHFVTIDTALSVTSYRDQLLENCRRDMAAFRCKYAALTEVSNILLEMEKIA